ncbi:hypothetical protein HAZT_HAZT001604, partial [Hyalella azteca]
MTVSYTKDVVSNKGLGCFLKLLLRWRGSVYKLIWMDLLVYLTFYFALSFVYRLFEQVSLTCSRHAENIPLSFVLGFFVSLVVGRWWDQFRAIPWPDTLALFVSTSLAGNDRRGRMMRRTILRYINFSMSFTFSMISPIVKRRFPTLAHFEDAGFITGNERQIYSRMSERTPHTLYWMPMAWAGALVCRARKENRIKDDIAMKTIIDEITRLRSRCGSLLGYDAINIPLVYTQKFPIDYYFPVFTTLQFCFYMGWLKVAESLINPFGDDDDDFEMNFLVDRNLQ